MYCQSVTKKQFSILAAVSQNSRNSSDVGPFRVESKTTSVPFFRKKKINMMKYT